MAREVQEVGGGGKCDFLTNTLSPVCLLCFPCVCVRPVCIMCAHDTCIQSTNFPVSGKILYFSRQHCALFLHLPFLFHPITE